MDAKEVYKYMSWCISKNILIYPKASNTGKYRIIICRNGKEKLGNEIYQDKETYKTVDVKTKNGVKKEKVRVPPLHDRIYELYKDIFEKNNLIPQ